MPGWDHLVVGAGFAGAVTAERLASGGAKVLIIDRRRHVGGNAHDGLDAHGVLVHTYGPHVFHTESDRVFAHLSRFTEWRPYQHRVLSVVAGRMLPFPINRTTINRLYGLDLDAAGVAAFLEARRERRAEIRTSEDVVLDRVGRELCDLFYRGYSRKQWGMDLAELAPEVAGRIPVRHDDDDRFFTDRHQAMPAEGYTRMFERMLDHPNITLRTGVPFDAVRDDVVYGHLVHTGPIDEYFGHRLGRLPYRAVRFDHLHLPDVERHQPVGTVNTPGPETPHTRTTEFRHLTGQCTRGTSIVRELPQDDGEPAYPVPTAANAALHRRYAALAAAEPRTTFLGRLAEYRYYNMDRVVEAALAAADRLSAPAGATA